MLEVAALALLAAGCWGVTDFTAGIVTRRTSVLLVLGIIQGTGLLIVLAVVAISGENPPGGEGLLAALAAGIVGAVGLGCFFRALAIGTMSVVAPIAATGVVLPVVVGIATGDALSAVTSIGLVVTVAGVVMVSREHSLAGAPAAARKSIALALVSAVSLGSFFVLADISADASVAWFLILSRVLPVPILFALAFARRRHATPFPRGETLSLLLLAGVLDVTATALYAVANTKGALSIVAVVGSLYPVTTLILARVFLSERIRGLQAAGVAAAFAGVAMVVAG